MKVRGERNHFWKGGKPFITRFGYIRVLTPYDHPWRKKSKHNGWYIMEHRLVMEKHLGRYLRENELVHHLNGIKTDNRIENLALVTKRAHNKIHLDSHQISCKVPNCGGKFLAKGFCDKHYRQFLHHGLWKDLAIDIRK